MIVVTDQPIIKLSMEVPPGALVILVMLLFLEK